MLNLINVLDSKISNFDIFVLDYKSSTRYHLRIDSFDATKKYWKFGKDYLLDSNLLT